MKLTERILEISRLIEKNEKMIVEAAKIADETVIALYVLNKHKIKPGKKNVKSLQSAGYIKNGKITKDGQDFLKIPAVVKKLKAIMS